MKVSIIMGGTSAERDVSIKTGEAVFRACKKNSYDVEMIMIDDNYEESLNVLREANIVFNALHGTFGEDGTVQLWLEKNKIPFTGSNSVASALCMNKAQSKEAVKLNGFLTPNWIQSEEKVRINEIFFPCIVKPNSQGSTFGLTYVEKAEKLNEAVLISKKFDRSTLIEEYIEGREITVGIIEGKALPIIEIFPKNKIYDYNCKYTAGMSEYKCPAEFSDQLSEKIKRDSVKIFNLLGCSGYGRIDYIIDKNDNYYFLEINTLPGMTSTSLLPIAANVYGMSFSNLVKKIIEMGISA